MFRFKGATLLVDIGAGTFHSVTNVTEYNASGVQWDTQEVTNHNDETLAKKFVTTLKAEGTIGGKITPFDPDNVDTHDLLKSLAANSTPTAFKFVFPGDTLGTFTFTGYVMKLVPETAIGAVSGASFEITITGLVLDVAAHVKAVTVTDSHKPTYITGDKIRLTASFDEYVKVTGAPYIAVTINGNVRHASYVTSLVPSNTVAFEYTMVGGDVATAGQVTVATAITLNSGTIKDTADGAATPLTFVAPTTSTYTVN